MGGFSGPAGSSSAHCTLHTAGRLQQYEDAAREGRRPPVFVCPLSSPCCSTPPLHPNDVCVVCELVINAAAQGMRKQVAFRAPPRFDHGLEQTGTPAVTEAWGGRVDVTGSLMLQGTDVGCCERVCQLLHPPHLGCPRTAIRCEPPDARPTIVQPVQRCTALYFEF